MGFFYYMLEYEWRSLSARLPSPSSTSPLSVSYPINKGLTVSSLGTSYPYVCMYPRLFDLFHLSHPNASGTLNHDI